MRWMAMPSAATSTKLTTAPKTKYPPPCITLSAMYPPSK